MKIKLHNNVHLTSASTNDENKTKKTAKTNKRRVPYHHTTKLRSLCGGSLTDRQEDSEG